MQSRISNAVHWNNLLAFIVIPLFFLLPLDSPFLQAKESLFVIYSGISVLLILALLTRRRESEVVVKRSSMYLVAFAVYSCLSLFWAPDFTGALKTLLPLISGILFFLLYDFFYRNEDPDNRKQFDLIQTVVVISVVEAVIVLLQFLNVGPRLITNAGGKWRVFGTFGNPNYVAEFLLAPAFMALNLFLNENRKNFRRFHAAAFLVISLGIFATFSRSGLLIWAGGLFFYSLLYKKTTGAGWKEMLKTILYKGKTAGAILITGFMIIFIFIPIFRFDRALIRHISNKRSVTGRIFIWKNSLSAALSGLPLGAGVGGFPAAYAAAQYKHFNSGNTSFVNNGSLVKNAHNDILQFLVEYGAGAVLFLFFFWRIFRESGRDLSEKTLSIGILTGFYAISASGMLNFPLRVAPNMLLFFLLAALVHRNRSRDGILKTIRIRRQKPRILLLSLPVLLLFIYLPVRFLIASGYLRSGKLAMKHGQNKAAAALLDTAWNLDSSPSTAAAAVAGSLLKRGLYKKAYSIAASGVRWQPTPEGYRILAECAAKTGRPGKAIAALRKNAYTFRSRLSYSLEYIKALYEKKEFKKIPGEILRLNKTVGNYRFITSRIYKKQLMANNLGLSASLRNNRTVFSGRLPEFTCARKNGNSILLGSAGQGLFEFVPAGKKFKALKTPFDFVYSLFRDKKQMFAGTAKGVFYKKLQGGNWLRFSSAKGIDPPVVAIRRALGKIWFISRNRVSAYSAKGGGVTTVFRSLGGKPLYGLRCASSGFGQIIIGGQGRFFRITAGEESSFSIRVRELNTGRLVAPVIHAVHFLNTQLALFCTDRGLITVFLKNGTVLQRLHHRHDFTDAAFIDKTLLLFTANGQIILQELAEFLQRINKHVLSKASVAYAETTFQHQQIGGGLLNNRNSTRMVVYSGGFYRNWIFASHSSGLISQAGPYGQRSTLKPSLPAGPGAYIRNIATQDGSLYIFSENALWIQTGNTCRMLQYFPSGTQHLKVSRSTNHILFALDKTLYRIDKLGIHKIKIFPGMVTALRSSGTDYAIAVSGQGVQQYRKGRLYRILPVRHRVKALAVNGERVFCGTDKNGILIFSSGKADGSVEEKDGLPDGRITALSRYKNRLYIGTAGGNTAILDLKTGTLSSDAKWKYYNRAPVLNILQLDGIPAAVSPDSISFLGTDRRIRLRLSGQKLGIGTISGAALFGAGLAVSGTKGYLLFPGFLKNFRAYREFLETGMAGCR